LYVRLLDSRLRGNDLVMVMLAKLVPYLIRERASSVLLYAVCSHEIRSM